jgi:hypothetical protein
MSEQSPDDFERLAADERRQSLVAELWDFLSVNKKWWLLPIAIVLGLMALISVLTATPAAPFIYTLF